MARRCCFVRYIGANGHTSLCWSFSVILHERIWIGIDTMIYCGYLHSVCCSVGAWTKNVLIFYTRGENRDILLSEATKDEDYWLWIMYARQSQLGVDTFFFNAAASSSVLTIHPSSVWGSNLRLLFVVWRKWYGPAWKSRGGSIVT